MYGRDADDECVTRNRRMSSAVAQLTLDAEDGCLRLWRCVLATSTTEDLFACVLSVSYAFVAGPRHHVAGVPGAPRRLQQRPLSPPE